MMLTTGHRLATGWPHVHSSAGQLRRSLPATSTNSKMAASITAATGTRRLATAGPADWMGLIVSGSVRRAGFTAETTGAAGLAAGAHGAAAGSALVSVLAGVLKSAERTAARLSANCPTSLSPTSTITPTELGRRAGDVEVGVDVDHRAVTLRPEHRAYLGRSRAVAAGVAPAGVDHRAVRGLVLVDDVGLALVGEANRPELDLDLGRTGEVVTVDRLDCGPRHAGTDELDVQQDLPGLVDGDRHGERVRKIQLRLLAKVVRHHSSNVVTV
jgi:hypothetical protein